MGDASEDMMYPEHLMDSGQVFIKFKYLCCIMIGIREDIAVFSTYSKHLVCTYYIFLLHLYNEFMPYKINAVRSKNSLYSSHLIP